MKIRVRPGDSFWRYSQVFGVPYQLIEDSNPSLSVYALQIGQEVNIPGYKMEQYTIQAGDTFWQLARKRNVSVEAVVTVNPQLNPNTLQVGQQINLPLRITTPIVDGNKDYDFQTLQDDLLALINLYPFLRVQPIGYSVLGKPIYEVLVGRGSRVIHFNGAFHANEWITVPVLMRILNEYLISLTTGKPIRGINTLPLYFNNLLSLVPMVNPDGVDLVLNGPPDEMRDKVIAINKGSLDFSQWKANIRGVDLNNQYPANWEIEKERKEPKQPAPRDYPGDAPLTEPEAIAMARLAQIRQFARVFAFHTQGEEFYWGYEGLEPPESVILASELARVSGYLPVRYIDSHAGYKDWFIYIYRRPGFTFELGSGVNPLPISQFPQLYEEMLGVFLVALYL